MYAKSGSMEAAGRAFNKMPSRNVVSWNAILGGCSMHSHGKEAIKHFERMCKVGVQPNDITFVCLLSACSHAGLVDEGMHCYDFIDHNLYDFCMWRGKPGAPWVNPEVLSFTRSRTHATGLERMKPCVLSDTSQQHANFVSIFSNERPHLVCPLNHVLGGSWILL
jgi:pentatricopeptide repeat protein